MANHLQGNGCAKCKRYVKAEIKLCKYLKKANDIHNNKYDYSKVNYVNSSTKVIIICLKHGEFEQTFNCHIHQKQGCPQCCFDNMKLSNYQIPNLLKKRVKYMEQNTSMLKQNM